MHLFLNSSRKKKPPGDKQSICTVQINNQAQKKVCCDSQCYSVTAELPVCSIWVGDLLLLGRLKAGNDPEYFLSAAHVWHIQIFQSQWVTMKTHSSLCLEKLRYLNDFPAAVQWQPDYTLQTSKLKKEGKFHITLFDVTWSDQCSVNSVFIKVSDWLKWRLSNTAQLPVSPRAQTFQCSEKRINNPRAPCQILRASVSKLKVKVHDSNKQTD